jgi:hypothetical protein
MTTLFLIILSAGFGFGAGFLSGLKNAKSSKVEKAKTIIDAIRK